MRVTIAALGWVSLLFAVGAWIDAGRRGRRRRISLVLVLGSAWLVVVEAAVVFLEVKGLWLQNPPIRPLVFRAVFAVVCLLAWMESRRQR